MGHIVCLHDRSTLLHFFSQEPLLHLYEIGDLDPFFWKRTTWLGLQESDAVQAVCLLYNGLPNPTLLAFSGAQPLQMKRLLEAAQLLLPRTFYGHISPDLSGCLEGWSVTDNGLQLKMGLQDKARAQDVDTSEAVRLTTIDLEQLQELYQRSYPDNWFDQRMLETNHYYGIRIGRDLCSAGGVHVYSKQYGVAALGNVTTDPEHRGKGLARAVTAKICQELLDTVSTIGLNVKADNEPAIACYRRLGFEVVAEYGEYLFEL